ncbi:MAG TPA: HYR domain-containing protein, partial [Bacteroidales bacterium]|nr:HYR domain-containing protein [Bacteroidales bacterium]
SPPVTVTGGPYTVDLGSGLTLDGSGSVDPNASCGDQIVAYNWDLDNDSQFDDATGAVVNLTPAQVNNFGTGTHTIWLEVIDSFGAISHGHTTVTVYDNRPFASFSVTPNPAACNQTVSFDGSASYHGKPSQQIVSYEWDFDYAPGSFTTEGTGLTIGHAFPAFGSYTVALRVTDDNVPPKTSTVLQYINVNLGNSPPVAVAGGPYSGNCVCGLTLDGSGSYDPNENCGDEIMKYEWDLNCDATWDRLGATVTLDPAFLQTYPPGTYCVRLRVTDEFGLTSTDVTDFSILPLPPPTAARVPDQPAVCVGNLLSLTDVTNNAGCPNNCIIEYSHNGGSWTTQLTSFPAVAGMTNTIAIRMNCNGQTCGLSSVTTYSWDIETVPPTITCPEPVNTNAGQGQCYAVVTNLGTPQTDDNCGVQNTANDAPANSQYPVGTTIVTWTVWDVNGNSATCTQTVTVTDNQPPSITCPPDYYAYADNFVCFTVIPDLGTPQTNDNCGVASVTNDVVNNGLFPVGNHVVTWTVTDHNGNTATCTQDVIVTDNQPPTIICPPHINTHTDQGHCYATVANPGTPGVYDNCGVLSYHNDAPLNGQYAVGSHTITWYVVDIHGNTTQCSQTITVLDNEPPAITCPQQLTVNADPQQCYATIQGLGTPQTSDNCGVQTIINNAPLNGHYPVGNTVVTWTVFDIHGNSATCTQTVTVTDNQPPWLQCPQAVKHCIASGQNGEIVNGLAPLSGDHCGIQSVTYQITGITNGSGSNDASGTFFHAGQSWVTYTVTDVNGNTASCSFSVEIYLRPEALASAAPLELCQGEDFTLYGSGSGGSGSYQYQWTGPAGFSSIVQNPYIAGASLSHSGVYQLVVTDDHQCISANDASVTVSILAAPQVSFTGSFAVSCLDGDPIELGGGIPAGGTYSGNGVLNGFFYPSLAGPGTHVLTYTYSAGGNCTGFATNTVTVLHSLPAVVSVGAGGDYPTLTGNGGLFEALNNAALCGNMKAYIISNLQEPGTHALNQWLEDENGPYSLTIVPDQPVVRNITGNVNMELIRFNGADRVTVDGRYDFEGRYLLFRNLAGFNGTIAYMNDACAHTFRNCIIEGCNRATNGGLLMIGAGVSTGNDNILITENLFRNANASNPNNLLSSYSTVTQSNSGIQVLNNEFKNFRSSGVFVSGIGSATGWTVDGNSFYYDLAAAATTAQSAISFAPVSTSTNNFIRNNMIGGSAANGGGTAWVNSGAVALRGIYVKSGTYTIENNVITNIRMSSAGAASFTGIDLSVVQGLQSKVKYNTIGSATMPHAVSMAGTGAFTGILVNSSLPVQLLEGNIIGNITYTSAGTGSPVIAGIKANKAQLRKNRILEINVNSLNLTPTMYGVWFNGSTGASNECSNNMIAMGGGAVLNPLIYGIYEGSAANTTALYYYNTVNIYGTASTTKKSYCFYRQNSVNVTIKNNIFSNFRVASPLGQYAIYTVSGTYWTYCDYNDLYSATAPIAGWAGADKATFALWKTASGKDAHSVNVMPVYTSNTDLHLFPSNTGIDAKGNPIATYTTDIDGNIRNVATPDIGCDEFTAVYPRLEEEGPQLADLRVYPNPFTSTTNLEIILPDDQDVDMCVYNVLGERVGEITSGLMYRGKHTITFDAAHLPAGTYICRLVAGERIIVKRMQLLK